MASSARRRRPARDDNYSWAPGYDVWYLYRENDSYAGGQEDIHHAYGTLTLHQKGKELPVTSWFQHDHVNDAKYVSPSQLREGRSSC